jgi:hypothetical protein
MFAGIPSRRTGFESLVRYEKAGEQHGLSPCFFRLCDIRADSDYVRAYIKQGPRYVRAKIPMPQVIHNRGLWFHRGARRKLLNLSSRGHTIFNQWNRYGKLRIHELLMLDPGIRPHLPHTVEGTPARLLDMMQLYGSLIVKPNSGSVGRGIMKLQSTTAGWELDYAPQAKRRARKKIAFRSSTNEGTGVGAGLPKVLIRRMAAQPLIIQQRLPLATLQGRPFDLRVSVQKNHTGEWQVTGINVKLAPKQAFLTNVAQGATVYTLPELLAHFPHLNLQQVYSDVCGLSLRIARQLDSKLPGMADLGLDIGLTEHGFPMFIECNGRDQRYTFREAGMTEEWQATFSNPIGYAKHLLDFS